jgi:hypothetical protein
MTMKKKRREPLSEAVDERNDHDGVTQEWFDGSNEQVMREARKMKYKCTPITALAWSVGAFLLLTGCAVSGANSTPGSAERPTQSNSPPLDSSQVAKAQKNEMAAFPFALPEGIQWPLDTPEFMKSTTSKFQEGVASATVAFYWLCAWEDNYLTSAHAQDEKREAEALRMIANFPTLPFYQTHVDDPHGSWFKSVVAPAQGGDSSGVEADVERCSYFYDQQG